jgi:hypothetical protein
MSALTNVNPMTKAAWQLLGSQEGTEFSDAQIQAAILKLTRWLEANYRHLTPRQAMTAREQVYFLVDAYAKCQLRAGRVCLSASDAVLTSLFRWAEPLGVVGGRLLYNRLKQPEDTPMKPIIRLPASMRVTLTGDFLRVSSPSQQWSFAVPYYFMIWNVADQDMRDQVRTQMVALSTGFARHAGANGSSQSTIVFIHMPETDPAHAISSWMKAYQFTEHDPVQDIGVRNLKSICHIGDDGLRAELVHWTSLSGPYAAVYSGMDGPYERNREHFVDFLHSVETR